MPDPTERFIEAAVAPLVENSELQVMARRELGQSISMAGATGGASLDDAAERLESADKKPHAKWWRLTLYAVTAILSVGILASSAASLLLFRQMTRIIGMFGSMGSGSDPDAFQKQLGRDLTPDQQLLLLGDTRRSGAADRIKGLWDSEPGNPAYFADYAAAHLSERASLPPAFLDTARKIDPDNGWFPIISAAESARAAIGSSAGPAKSPGGVKTKAIKDPTKLREALDLLHEAAALERFDNYQSTLLKQRIPLLPKRTDSLDQLVPVAYVAGLTVPSMRLRNLSDAVAAEAIRLAEDKDPAGFKRLVADWRAFTDTYASSDHGYLVDILVAVVMVRGPLKAFHQAATDLGLAEEAAWAKDLDDRFEQWKAATKAHVDPNEDMALRSSLLSGLTIPVVSGQSVRAPVLRPEDLAPGRLADHALAGRLLSLAAWLLLGMAALSAVLYRFRGSLLTRHLSARLTGLLRPGDWAWTFGIGILLPFVYHFAIVRFTPFGGREWSLKASGFMLPLGQFSSMLWMMILLPVMVARRRLALRGAALGWAGKEQILAWVAVIGGAAALPLCGLAFVGRSPSQATIAIAGSLLGLPPLYLLVIGFRALFSKQAPLLRRATVSRVLVPIYVSGMLLMTLAVPLFHAEERYWIARDRLTKVSADAPGIRYEWEVTQAMREELLEILEPK